MEVFFADGRWSIVPKDMGHDPFQPGWFSIAHKCGLFRRTHVTPPGITRTSERPYCGNCKEEVPAALVGLWKMHNWDHIQETEAYMYRFRSVQYFYAGKPLFYTPKHNTQPGLTQTTVSKVP